MPFYSNPDSLKHDQLPPIKTFYVDDSSCLIGGVHHTLLAAIGFWDESPALSDIVRLKKQLGLRLEQELKWNSHEFTKEQRESISEGILPILSHCQAFLVGTEHGKQSAAIELTTTLSDFCRGAKLAGFLCRFDKDILDDPDEFDRHSYNLDPPCVGWSEADSAHEPLLQCADLFVGFQKLRIDMGTGLRNPSKPVQIEVYEGTRTEYPLSWYLHMAFRYCIWGEREEPHRPGNDWKNNLGMGIRFFSSVPELELKQALKYVERDFLGCIH
jgi:hypothetical protein